MHWRSGLSEAVFPTLPVSTNFAKNKIFVTEHESSRHTCVTGRRVAKLVSVTRGQAHTDVSARQIGTSLEVQLLLQSVGVGIATIHDVVNGAGVTTFSHEHFGGVVKFRVLKGTVRIKRLWPS